MNSPIKNARLAPVANKAAIVMLLGSKTMVARGKLFSRSAIGSSRHQAPRLGLRTGAAQRQGEVKLDPETGSIVVQRKSGLMQVGYRSNQAETEAVTGTVAAAFEAITPPQDVFAFHDRHARSVIGYRKNGPIDAFRDRDANLAVVTAVLDRVVHEGGNRVEQEIAIADYGHDLAGVELEPHTPLLGRRFE